MPDPKMYSLWGFLFNLPSNSLKSYISDISGYDNNSQFETANWVHMAVPVGGNFDDDFSKRVAWTP